MAYNYKLCADNLQSFGIRRTNTETQERNNMIEINRWQAGAGNPIPNPEFLAIFDGKKLDRSPLLECSGRYEGCFLYNGVVYENWVNWGYDCLFRLDQEDLNICHQDREGRVGETLKPCLMGACTDVIRGTLPL